MCVMGTCLRVQIHVITMIALESFSALEKEHNDYWLCKGFIYLKRRKIYQSFTFLSLTVPTATNRFTVMFGTCVWTNDLKGNISAGPIPDTTSVVYV